MNHAPLLLRMPMTYLRPVFFAALFAILALANFQARAADTDVDFSRDVRPILSDKCFKCHGPDPNTREADLRLDIAERAADVTSAEVAGDSELLRRILTDDVDEIMPPVESKMSLTDKEKEILRRWIVEGNGEFQQHWAFVPRQKVVPPKIKQVHWPRGEIDQFILARLEKEGLATTTQAPKEKLIRRVSFDLTGLPPTSDEIDTFLADDSPAAYEKLVDRLLAKPAYGERMASAWLDVARYSDTFGYQVDRDRRVWPWRDWVIEAFNANQPYDEFITWQLAGDLLPGASDEQILATTFNRLHPQKVEGGSTPEEFRVEYVADRNQTFGTAFLGLSLQCARCHDHKYDPVSQKEYYGLYAFFNNIDESGLYSYSTQSVPTPTLFLPDEAKRTEIARAKGAVAKEEATLRQLQLTQRDAFGEWLADHAIAPAIPGRVAEEKFEVFDSSGDQRVDGVVGKAIKMTGDDGIGLDVGNFSRHQPFSIALWMNTPDVKDRAVVFHRSGGWTDAGSRGYQLLIENGKLSASLIHFWPGNAIRIRTKEPITTKTWHHVAFVYDGSSRAAGLTLYLNGKPADTEVVRDKLTKNITGGGGDNLALGARNRDRGFTNGMLDEFQVYDRQLTEIEVAQLHDGTALATSLTTPYPELSRDRTRMMFEYFLATQSDPYKQRLEALSEARKKHYDLVNPVDEIMVMRDMPSRRQTYYLDRGAYDAPTEKIEPHTPSVFPPLPADAPRDRLSLARWLTDPTHPLTSRVIVNRYWQLCFGEGLVRTPEDFGSQGELPSHPALLDWLANDFVAHGWDVRRLLKQIVTSATYRQSTHTTDAIRQRDLDNRLLARGPSYRLSAEMLRDNALFTSGLLVDRIGGPPAKPYEVAVSFKPVDQDKGEGLYRRSVYTYWKRTGPAPAMMVLDAAKRDVCIVKRERTSSPLQSFVLLNGPQFVEAARALAQRTLLKHEDDTSAVVSDIFRTLTSRRPSQAEQTLLSELVAEQQTDFEKKPKAAAALLATGDAALDESLPAARLAAVTLVTNMLMSYDECMIKR